ncbi:MAG TPA: Na-translocating system protein MpsC family protein [Solirubrobacteraceae bacterium]
MQEVPVDGSPPRPTGGHLLAAISTRIVAILRESYGRGPIRAKTYAIDDLVVVVMRGSGFTPLEQTMMDDDGADHLGAGAERVVAMRHDFQRMIAVRYTNAIEELTGRNVVAFLSQAHVEPDITIEIFCIDGPLEGVRQASSPTASVR